MPRSVTEHSDKSRAPTVLQEFEKSLPDFKSLDDEQHLRFLKAIRLMCEHFDISEAQLRSGHFLKFRSTIARLDELYKEYDGEDAVLASAILNVKLHIESHYLDDEDASLVHNLTGLHIPPRTTA
jgi:hypothetical protein